MSHVKCTGLFRYPIKSCRREDLAELQIGPDGPEFDRQWMLVDEGGAFVSQRKAANLARVNVSVSTDGELSLSLDSEVPRKTCLGFDQVGDAFECRIFKEVVDCVEVSHEASRWFSEFLSRKVRLVRLADGAKRRRDKKTISFTTRFADGYPLLLINKDSVDALSEVAGEPIPYDRFRTNILIEGASAYEEDDWKKIEIGRSEFVVPKRCTRCVITSICQTTGKKNKEAVRSLGKTRMLDGQMYFGINLVHLGSGTIKVGDPVREIS